MKTKKMSLANIQGKLSRAEMKEIMAGSGGTICDVACAPFQSCFLSNGTMGTCVLILNHPCCVPQL